MSRNIGLLLGACRVNRLLGGRHHQRCVMKQVWRIDLRNSKGRCRMQFVRQREHSGRKNGRRETLSGLDGIPKIWSEEVRLWDMPEDRKKQEEEEALLPLLLRLRRLRLSTTRNTECRETRCRVACCLHRGRTLVEGVSRRPCRSTLLPARTCNSAEALSLARPGYRGQAMPQLLPLKLNDMLPPRALNPE